MSSLTSSSNQHPRNLFIDQCRGLALILMAVFHFCYDLSLYGLITFNSQNGFFPHFRYLIVTLFFISVGYGLYCANAKRIQWRAFWWREAKILAGALVISVTTYLMYPSSWVWFGVLHFIAVASLLSLPLLRWPFFALILWVGLFFLYNFTSWANLQPLWILLKEPLYLPDGTQDLTRLIPWIGMVWIGIYVGSKGAFGIPAIPVKWISTPLLFLSRHSLIFYLIHQAPLFGLAWFIGQVL